jgi:hypothetical protein
VTSSPSSRTWPELGANSPAMMLNRVDLPAPFGPISPVIEPRATASEQPSTAWMPPKLLLRFSTWIMPCAPRDAPPAGASP